MTLVALLMALQTVGLPNPVLTPGAVRPLKKTQICAIHWRFDHRHVTEKMKQQVIAAYGLAWAEHGHYEIYHLVPRNLGGADSVLNLWPMCCIEHGRIVGPAHEKDVQEVRTGRLLCSGHMTLSAAQALFPAQYRAGAVP